MALFDVDAAVSELHAKTLEQIERATAITWGGRAAAAFRLAAEATSNDVSRHWFMAGENYRQEALEHAAMAEDFGFLREIAGELDGVRAAALAAVQGA